MSNTVFVILRALGAYKIRKKGVVIKGLSVMHRRDPYAGNECVTLLTGKVHVLAGFNHFDIVFSSCIVYFTYKIN